MAANVVNRVRLILFGLVLLLPGGLVGCGGGSDPKLETTTVRGRVVFEKGGSVKKLHDVEAAVVFESLDRPGLRGTAAIAEDGSLANVVSMETKGKASGYGLVKGSYRVRLELDPEHRGLVNARFLSFDKSGITVQVPRDDVIVIKVWR